MGDFRIVVEAMGGHGCDRKAAEGDEVRGCGREDCPDCVFARFVSNMQRAGIRPDVATFTHWPASMRRHRFEEDNPKCLRCGITAPAESEVCRSYTEEREVVDDYTERGVKYPTGGFVRATGKRVKGSF